MALNSPACPHCANLLIDHRCVFALSCMVKLVSRGKRLAKVNINATPCGRRGRNTDVKLDTLEIGKDAVVASVASDDQALRQHILDMGLTPGTEVTKMKYAP